MRPNASKRLESAATTDGTEIIVAGDDAEILDNEEPTYTYHTEPADQGGQRYVRCTECGAELLVELGGKNKLLHKRDCPRRDE